MEKKNSTNVYIGSRHDTVSTEECRDEQSGVNKDMKSGDCQFHLQLANGNDKDIYISLPSHIYTSLNPHSIDAAGPLFEKYVHLALLQECTY